MKGAGEEECVTDANREIKRLDHNYVYEPEDYDKETELHKKCRKVCSTCDWKAEESQDHVWGWRDDGGYCVLMCINCREMKSKDFKKHRTQHIFTRI